MSRRFQELLEQLRDQFEMVILDTPPVLVVTDPLNVAARVDGVLVVLRLSKNTRTGSRRTLDALEEVGANVLGVVVNGVDATGSGYGGYAYDRWLWHPICEANGSEESDDRGHGRHGLVDPTKIRLKPDETARRNNGKD